MQVKIRELDNMYRPKIEVALPSEDFSAPVEEPVNVAPAPQKQQSPAPSSTNTKPQEEKVVTKKTVENKPAENKPTENKSVEKKPAKKVIVE
jgi:hypothetical protein